MKKVLVSVFAALSVLAVSALCFAAWSPVVPPVQTQEPAPVVQGSRPVTLEQSAVLVLVQEKKELRKARLVAKKAKSWTCGDFEPTALGTMVRKCDWR